MATEVIHFESVNLVRCELKGADGKTVNYGDLEWPTKGNLVLSGGDGGVIASGELLPNGLRPTLRFTGKGLRLSDVQVSYRPLDPAATDPAKVATMTLLSFTADPAPADANQQQPAK